VEDRREFEMIGKEKGESILDYKSVNKEGKSPCKEPCKSVTTHVGQVCTDCPFIDRSPLK